MSELYKQSGVDTQRADELTQRIKEKTKSENIGRFSALVKMPEFADYQLVTTVDGIGTKIIPLLERNDLSTIANDVIAMNLNDIICSGARVVSFSDYIALNSIDVEKISEIVSEISRQLADYGCVLSSGETSEMRSLISSGNLDIAGFAVGVVHKNKILPKLTIQKGDLIVGLVSNGVHSNGFSLIRKLYAENKLTDAEFIDTLKPTRIYYKGILALCEKNLIKSAANITGGGLRHNLARALPECKFKIDISTIPTQAIFNKLYELCDEEAYNVFNMGVGFCVVCSPQNLLKVKTFLSSFAPFVLGEVL